ncbi:hypothetical protein P691DRAFT_785531 [Macrolepiota fuliginosa MF-IS2]|uniref:Uncharacterized protein n=1 Tax=Macrolepiota fuliginosa MF-IS2 TaxID=1400762 RepID=A0A9P6BZB4_9AGAR|nr:hypothetical protein P691DRAFT_785531 [Macrolepiota fuliginosa MF-IS2]
MRFNAFTAILLAVFSLGASALPAPIDDNAARGIGGGGSGAAPWRRTKRRSAGWAQQNPGKKTLFLNNIAVSPESCTWIPVFIVSIFWTLYHIVKYHCDAKHNATIQLANLTLVKNGDQALDKRSANLCVSCFLKPFHVARPPRPSYLTIPNILALDRITKTNGLMLLYNLTMALEVAAGLPVHELIDE